MASPLPYDSARMAWWLSAWLRGDAGPDDLLDAVVGDDAAHDVSGLADEPLPLVLALGRLRAAGARTAGLALPSPGDPVGLGGPREFNAAALDMGEAVLLEGAGLGLVPHRAGRPAAPPRRRRLRRGAAPGRARHPPAAPPHPCPGRPR